MLNPKIPVTVFNNLSKNTQNKYKINSNHYLLKELKPEKYEHLSNNQKNKYMKKINYEYHPNMGMAQKTNEKYILLPKLLFSAQYDENLNSTQQKKIYMRKSNDSLYEC